MKDKHFMSFDELFNNGVLMRTFGGRLKVRTDDAHTGIHLFIPFNMTRDQLDLIRALPNWEED